MANPVYTCLWFKDQAHEAAEYYTQIFRDSEIVTKGGMAVTFRLNGTLIMALNHNREFEFNPSTSLVVECDTQEEIDYYWEKLGFGGNYSMCGWLDDRYGVSWQIIPKILGELMSDPERAPKAIQAFMKMQKFDIQKLLEG